MKKLTFITAMIFVIGQYNLSKAQVCSTDLTQTTSKMVHGSFAAGENGMSPAYLRQNGNNVVVDVLDNETGELYEAQGTVYNYYLSNVEDRIVSGDFDLDGEHDDIAIIYQTGTSSCRIDILEGTSSGGFTMHYNLWSSTGYNPDNVTGRVVSGEFDHSDHYYDIAAFYDYGSGETRIHVWRVTSSWTVNYSGSSGWWSTTGYTAGQITDRVVSGDFDGDDYWDDIAAFYDYGSGQTRIHVWLSEDTYFDYQGGSGWYTFPYGYNASNISKRVVAGDFNRDGECDEICAFYDYGGGAIRAHVWKGKSNSAPAWHNDYFEYQGNSGWWSVTSGYTPSQINNKVVMVYDGGGVGGKFSDIVALYNYGSSTTKYHFFESSGSSFSYSHVDFCSMAPVQTGTQILEGNESNFASNEEISGGGTKLYPNPSEGELNIEFSVNFSSGVIIMQLMDMSGKVLISEQFTGNETATVRIDISDIPQGLYLVKLTNEKGDQEVIKITKN